MTRKFLTILVVPHDERNVRRLRLSYGRIRFFAILAGLVVVGVLLAGLTWGRIASRAARSEMLERQNRSLVAENRKVAEIAANLERTESAYDQIRSMAGLARGNEGAEGLGPEMASAAGASESAPPIRRPSELAGRGGTTPSGWPLTIKGFVSAAFTGRDDHPGVDVAVPLNTPVVATARGTVRQTGSDPVYGNFLVLAHEDGFETMYAHNGHLLVERGERVERGQVIAYSGNSGRSSAPHLHYEVRRGSWPVDPQPFLR